MSNFSTEVNERKVFVNERITITENKKGQSFGADAFLLSAYALPDPAHAAVDLGSGSSICSLLLADHDKARHIYAAELQSELHELAKRNITDNGLEDKVTAMRIDIRLLNAQAFPEKIGTVISNPPYFTAESGIQSPIPGKNAARFELNGTLYDFCAAAQRILMPSGRFFCVIRPERVGDLVAALRAAGLEPSRMTFVHHNTSSAPAMLLTEAIKGRRGMPTVTRSLFLYDGKVHTPNAARIYETCDFGDFFNER